MRAQSYPGSEFHHLFFAVVNVTHDWDTYIIYIYRTHRTASSKLLTRWLWLSIWVLTDASTRCCLHVAQTLNVHATWRKQVHFWFESLASPGQNPTTMSHVAQARPPTGEEDMSKALGLHQKSACHVTGLDANGDTHPPEKKKSRRLAFHMAGS